MRQSKTNADETTTNADKFSLDSPLPKVGEDYPEADETPSWSPTKEGKIGRYRVEKLLGNGGFGFVFLAHDDHLSRSVAIKVPSPRLVTKVEDAGPYMAEARNVANLDHPNIVPVYDVGTTVECPCYIVSRYVEGSSLADHLRESPVSIHDAAKLVAVIAEALHFAHEKGLVHRDVKPGNIMLGSDGTPHLIDFGLALREEHVGQGPRYVGTPAYMSPEQARGEGHRVDRRSDIYSLGCVLYLMLTGCRPFDGERKTEILQKVVHEEPESPRHLNASISKELERICNKAMRKRSVDRYATAQAMADDLNYCLQHRLLPNAVAPHDEFGRGGEGETSTNPGIQSATLASGSQQIRIIPKGLRSFDENDSDFFLELLPGPRDLIGLPDSLRFWKAQVEEQDADKTFPVGLVYGPSGCGKSSLIKAGLLPRLNESVIPVFVESTPDGTETVLLGRLRKLFPELDRSLSLSETLASFRRQEVRSGKKLLIVFDQFEQWLHANHDAQDSELVRALRQCDGGCLQCLILVRDDFWLAVSRFMQALEIEVIEGWNWALVDLFDPIHARKVLTGFGVAYDRLPSSKSQMTPEQSAFLDQAVSDLSEEGKVVPVRLAAFAEMFKGKSWTLSVLQEVGGSSGIGVSFLEETFQSPSAPPKHRIHQKAAQAVLRSMLPEAGTQIKAPMRSETDLLEACGYADRPEQFQELIRMLDRDIRLITPAEFASDPNELDNSTRETSSVDVENKLLDEEPLSATGNRHYQLTHDYLVRPIRDWLTRKQRTSFRGRAELRLSELAAVWQNTPNRHVLPGLGETIQIRWFTAKRSWTTSEKEMMQQATRYYALRGSAMILIFALVFVAGREGYRRIRARGIVDSLLTAKISEVPSVLNELSQQGGRPEPFLRAATRDDTQQPAISADPQADSRRKLNASLGLLQYDPGQMDFLTERLLRSTPAEVDVMLTVMKKHAPELVERMCNLVSKDQGNSSESQLLRAGCLLAAYAPQNDCIRSHGDAIAGALLQESPSDADAWIELLRPASPWLMDRLEIEFRDQGAIESTRVLAARALAKYAKGERLIALLLDANASQFQFLYPITQTDRWPGNQALVELIGQPMEALSAGDHDEKIVDLPNVANDPAEQKRFAEKKRNAAVALIRQGVILPVLPLLDLGPDPTTRTKLMLEVREFGTPLESVIACLDQADSTAQRQAMLIAAGSFAESSHHEHERIRLRDLAHDVLESDAPASLKSAAEWLLQQMGETHKTAPTTTVTAKNPDDQRPGLDVIEQLRFTQIPAAVRFMAGSPKSEEGREVKEIPEQVSIDLPFEISTREITISQFRRFRTRAPIAREVAPTDDCPMNKVSLLNAMKFCRWLSQQADLDESEMVYPPFPEITEDLVVTEEMLARPGYRLPTDAEWEYICRAESETPWFSGVDPNDLPFFASYSQNSDGMLSPVGRHAPNPFGCFDIIGNTAEWCHSTLSPKEMPQSVRGGKYTSLPSRIRSAQRYYYGRIESFSFTGFRLARTLPVPQTDTNE